ncbi:MAG: hypothetical protein CL927_17700 [Deltaproteobacteria bacterium]|mgnify:CR=1 FL=1|nr:hypothetical protein [Deltaproteobacteria bacterium]HCH65805.1 hypothetical protein [Deltaproteobacteria bacterium]
MSSRSSVLSLPSRCTVRPGLPLTLLLGLVTGVLGACNGNDKGSETLVPVDGSVADRVEVVPTIRAGRVELVARTVNSYRVAVGGGLLTLSATGENLESETVSDVVDTSITGVGSLTLPVTGPGRVDFSVVDSELAIDLGDAVGTSWTVDLPMSGWAAGGIAMNGSIEAAASFAAPGSGGVVLASEDEVWWTSSTPGEEAYIVADMPQNVAGLEAGHIDRDGILDLAIWSGNQAILLRGLEGGGYTWGTGWRAVEGDIVGVSLADADSDRITDVSIGSSGGGSGVVTVYHHDGGWSFDPYEKLVVNSELYSIAAGDETGDGRPDVSIFATVTGTIRRYSLAEEGWVGAQTSELPGYESADGGVLFPLVDLDGDDILETVIEGSADANTQDLVFYVVDPAGAGSSNYPQSYGIYDGAVADLNLDGRTDIVVAEDDRLNVISWDGESFEARASEGIGPHGPVAVADYSGDLLPDVAIATDVVRFHPGELNENGAWTRSNFDWVSYPTVYEPNMRLADVNGDGGTDIVGLQVDPSTGDVDVVAWQVNFDGVEPEINPLGSVSLVTSGVGHDLAVCDGAIFALSEGVATDSTSTASVINLTAIRYSGSDGATKQAEVAVERGTMIDCGTLENGVEGVVVSSTTGRWESFTNGLTAVGGGEVGSTQDIALADTDGDGLGEVVGCSSSEGECSMLVLDLNGDGVDEIVRSSDTTVLLMGETEQTIAGTGRLRAADIDGDGAKDVLGWNAGAGLLYIWRNVGTALAPPAGVHSQRGLAALAGLADMTGDGVPELVFIDENGALVHSAATTAAEGASW